MKTILAAIDNSVYSASVTSYACASAGIMGARVVGYHVLDTAHVRALEMALQTFEQSEDPRVIEAREEGPVELMKRTMADKEDEFRQSCAASGAAFVTEQDTGAPEREIARQANTVDLVIIGRHGTHAQRAGEYGLGHVAYQIATSAPKHVLVVPATYQPIQRPMVAFDGTAFSGHALEHVADICDATGATAHLVVVTGNEQVGGPLLSRGEKYLKRREVSFTSELRIGSPEGLYIDAARDSKADLIAVSGQQHSLFGRIVEYHTLDRVLEYAEVPVLVCR